MFPRASWIGAALAVGCGAAAAAQSPRPRVGVFFWHDSPNDAATYDGVRQGLLAAGFGCDFVERRGEADPARAAAALGELRTERCDLVLALGTEAALLADRELRDVPVVFAAVTNPVAAGLLPDWQASGRRLCGASNWIDPASVLDVFRLAVPGLRRLGMLRCKTSGVVSAAEFESMRQHLLSQPQRQLELFEAVASDDGGIEQATNELLGRGVDAIWIPIDIVVYQNIPLIERSIGGARVPLVSTAATAVRRGAMVGTAVDYRLHGRRAAAMILDVVRDGRDPATLPVDRMRSSLVIVNLAAARRNGIELPLSLLALADELIAPEVDRDGPR